MNARYNEYANLLERLDVLRSRFDAEDRARAGSFADMQQHMREMSSISNDIRAVEAELRPVTSRVGDGLLMVGTELYVCRNGRVTRPAVVHLLDLCEQMDAELAGASAEAAPVNGQGVAG